MATTQEILKAAHDLGVLISQHATARKFEETVQKLQGDVEAQRLMTDLNRQIEKLGAKEASGKPIEVSEKKELEAIQNKVIRHSLLQQFQMAQMDYLDLMRQVDAAIEGQADAGPAGAVSSGAKLKN